jgi:hypothetical protein
MTKEQIAEAVHEINRVLQGLFRQPVSDPWPECSAWQKQSSADGVAFVLRNPGCQGRDIHENWRADLLRRGWKLGPVKSEKLKEHPLLVPYEKLSSYDQAKDEIFIATVRALGRA